ncbi:MAG: hypothetical protein KBT82_17655 [Marinobacter sp.]|uniref:hypothetical protein n=1 Tax=Marinobacter sp. TaxID=50741 RepID=UPI001B703893|nr:hypothetical protein [Marinobacter sp.]MBQ0748512.1 hypothetical protein [Marinobacter sp.]MBQ0815972.1 hypothetical protein [Marinobacter sp.]
MPLDATYDVEIEIDAEKDLDEETVHTTLNLSKHNADYVREYADIGRLLSQVDRRLVKHFVAEYAATEAYKSGTGELNERLSDHGFKIIECE